MLDLVVVLIPNRLSWDIYYELKLVDCIAAKVLHPPVGNTVELGVLERPPHILALAAVALQLALFLPSA